MKFAPTIAALLCGALPLLAGCGGGNSGSKIPADQADRLVNAIAAADQYSSQGRCTRAHTKVRDARFLLTRVPQSVDSDVRRGISDGLNRLDSLISNECQTPQQTQTQTTPTQTETTQTDTTPTETTPTETNTTPTQTDTTPTQTTLTETTPTDTGTSTTPGNGGTPTGGTG